MYCEADYFMLSALQHYAFCPRQCALIHKEQFWTENVLTVKGELFHDRVDTYKAEKRKDFIREFSMPIRSTLLGISGKTDIVETRLDNNQPVEVVPIEYKSGKVKEDDSDKIQLCAQAICLEEMIGVPILLGYLYYGKDQKRHVIVLDEELRKKTIIQAEKIHQMLNSENLPCPLYTSKCKSCSLAEFCQPKLGNRSPVTRYIHDLLKER